MGGRVPHPGVQNQEPRRDGKAGQRGVRRGTWEPFGGRRLAVWDAGGSMAQGGDCALSGHLRPSAEGGRGTGMPRRGKAWGEGV